jgi:hypothetical protein
MHREEVHMKLRLLGLVVLLSMVPLAQADISGSVYRVPGNNLTAGNYSSGLEGTFTAPGINFFVAGPQGSAGTLYDFLHYGSASWTTMGGLSDVMSNCPNNVGNNCYSTAITITGSQYFAQGASYSLTHDDGVLMNITGFNAFINAPGPVSEETTSATFTGTSGIYNYTIYYMATNGNPEVLESSSIGVPDGGTTVLLFGFALSALGLVSRRMR